MRTAIRYTHPDGGLVREVPELTGKRTHGRIACLPRSFTVLACGPFSPDSSTKVTCAPSSSLVLPSTLLRWK